MKYIFNGNTEVELIGFGIVKPNQTIESKKVINNPQFQIVVEKVELGNIKFEKPIKHLKNK